MLVTDIIAKNIGGYDKIIVETPEEQRIEVFSKKHPELYLEADCSYVDGKTLIILTK